MITVQCAEIDPPGGHYAHAIAHAGVLYISGQLGRGAGMSDHEAGGIREQTRRALDRIRAIACAGGSDLSRLLKVNIYISSIEHWPVVNEEFARVMLSHRPARSIVPSAALHFGALVEIDAIAALA